MTILHRFAITVLFAAVSMVSQIAAAQDIYVDNIAGNDKLDGRVPISTGQGTGPLRSIGRALQVAKPGARVILKHNPGYPYRESITLFGSKNSGAFNGMPFIIEGNIDQIEGNEAILEGADQLRPEIWSYFRDDIYRYRPMQAPVNLTYGQMFSGGVRLDRVKTTPAMRTLPDLEPLQWCVFQGQVYFRAEQGKSPKIGDHYKLSYSARPTGITLMHVNNVRIHDIIVRGYQVDGIAAPNSAKDVILDTVLSEANGRAGLSAGVSSRIFAGYSVFSKNNDTQVLAMQNSKMFIYGCLIPEGIGETIRSMGGKVDEQKAPEGAAAKPAVSKPQSLP